MVLPFAVFGAVAGWLAFRIPLPKPVTHGSARFRSRSELDAFRGPDGLIVGRAAQPDHFLLRYAGPGHLLTIAPTRAGKGVGAILPNLLLADRPVIVIDPKGENYRVAARARNRFGPVWELVFGSVSIPDQGDGQQPIYSSQIARDFGCFPDVLEELLLDCGPKDCFARKGCNSRKTG